MVGWTGNKMDPMPLTTITVNEINLIGSMIYCMDFPAAIELAVSRAVNLSSIISHKFKFSETNSAFEELSGDQHDIIKAIIEFPEEDD